ncbi:MAG: TonB-dependent receptor [Sphingobium sp.]|jgi:iron complex outermembrane receptor protein
MTSITNHMWRMAGCSTAAIAALLAMAGQASAQDTTTGAEDQGLEDIVVTAQRRSESIQDVPVAVTAFSAQELQRANIQDVGAYFQNTPNVFITDSPVRSGNNVSSSALGLALRGISNVGGNASSFGIYLDDFNISHIALNPHLIDMERIEVLRGPQGTYFGRNASGGVMSLNTQKPDASRFAGEANAMIGRFGTYELGGMVNVPLSDTIAIRAAGKWETSDGEFNNKHPVGGGNGRDYKAARLSARATPTESLTIDLSYNYAKEHDDDFGLIHTGVLSDFIKSICPGVTFSCPVDSNLGFYPNNRRNYAHDAPLVVNNEYHIAVGRIAWTGENVGVTSITGYGSAKFNRSGELDFSSVDFLREGFNYDSRKSFSQELRIQSVGDKRLNWIVGAVYARDKHREGEFIAAGKQNDIGLPEDFPIELSHFNQKITSKAVFAEATFDVTDALSLTAGARYSHDKLDRFEDQIEFGGPLQNVRGSRSFSDVSPRFAIKYAASDDVNIYGSVSKGWKSGGFELDPQRARSDFGAETLWNYEVGVKSTLLDNHLRANLAFFYIDWSDVQVSSGVVGRDANGNIINYAGISNAASATSKGVELELLAAPTERLELGLNVGYLKARFDKFTDARTNFGTLDLSGKPLPKAPEWTLSTFAQYTAPLTDSLDAFVRGEYFYTDDAYTTVNNIAAVMAGQPTFPYLVKGYGKVNLRLGLENERFRVAAYVENLFDKKYYSASFDFGFANGAAVVPGLRRWGLRGSVKF